MAAADSLAAPSVPRLTCTVAGVDALAPAAAPTLRFALALDACGAAIRSLTLAVQLQIAARERRYDAAEQAQLADLFGAPERWGQTLHTLPWTRAALVVGPFEGTTTAALDVPCTYDFEVAAARYLAALSEGEIPLELLLSGTVFWTGADGRLQAGRIPWECEASCALPVRTWRAALDACFPGSAWVRLERDAFERLAAFRAARALPSWEAVVEELLAEADDAR
ncbi:MAG TPA: DUF6084 family protein [Conexibacter sp.]|nr:DUF6084 family protein [Conexibacter sp.]